MRFDDGFAEHYYYTVYALRLHIGSHISFTIGYERFSVDMSWRWHILLISLMPVSLTEPGHTCSSLRR